MNTPDATGWSRRELVRLATAAVLLPWALSAGSTKANAATGADASITAVVDAVAASPRLSAVATRESADVVAALAASPDIVAACKRMCGGDDATVAAFARRDAAERRRTLRAVLTEAFTSSRVSVRLAAIEADSVIRAVLGGLLPAGSPVCVESYEI